jgi:carboxylesterase type B
MVSSPKIEQTLKSCSYRINWQGFLACQDLIDEAKALGQAPSNFGLYDQRAAFQWVQKYIPGFGGNGEDVTAFGESAGSVSLALQMCSNVPLFQRAVLQSGTPSLGTPIRLAVKERQYRQLLKFCGIDDDDPERLQKLRNVPVEKLIEGVRATGVVAFGPLADSRFFPEMPDCFNEARIFEKCDWVKDIIIGDSIYEVWKLSLPTGFRLDPKL